MKRASTYRSKPLILLLVLASALLAACSAHAAAQSAGDSTSYSGALNTAYENALDPTSQLALGTLRLEGTPDAVTEGQAADLLLLWQALAGNELQGNAERAAVIKQIEATMTEAQIAAIVAMQLTEQDAQDWTQGQFSRSLPGSGQAPGGQQGSGDTPRGAPSTGTGGQAGRSGQLQNMSPEQQATRRAQFGQQASSTGRSSTTATMLSRGLVSAVIRLLSDRSGQATAQAAAPAATPAATPGQAQASTPTPGQPNAPEPTTTPEPAATATPSPAEEASATPEPLTTVTPSPAEETSTTPDPAATATPSPAEEASVTPDPAATATPSPAEETSTTPQATPAATPTPTPEPAVYVVQAGDSLAAIARAYGVSAEAIVEANNIQDPNLIDVGQALIIPGATRIPTAPIAHAAPSTSAAPNPPPQAATTASAWSSPGLQQLPDKDPGPPFTIQVSANRALQDPLVAKSKTYQVTGTVRNDGDQTYAVSAIHVTFFDASGFRGTYFKFPGRGQTGGEWIWHGVTEADVPYLLLAPGEECPFSVQITAQDMASFLIHPDAEPTGRESAAVALSNVRLIGDEAGYVRITGTATNTNPFKVKDVTVAGTLLNASGQIVQVGSTYVLQNVEPGASVSFDLRIAEEAYASYHLYAQAERDW
jgi:LysM repeat protein